MPKISRYRQTTYESCLACCLLQRVAQLQTLKLSKKLELACLLNSLNYSRDDFVAGHLEFVTKKFKVQVERYVDNDTYRKYLHRFKVKNATLKTKKTTLTLINSLLDSSPIILLVDTQKLFNTIHYPHWITVLEKKKNTYKVFDTWEGKQRTLTAKQLQSAISKLRNHLRMAPQVVIVKKLTSNS
jgi:hypothetical protein